MTIDWTKPVELIETGERLTVLTTEAPNDEYPVIVHDERGYPKALTNDGRVWMQRDIAVRNVREKVKRTVWLNVYAQDDTVLHRSEHLARTQACSHALAVAVPVEVEFYVGQGKE